MGKIDNGNNTDHPYNFKETPRRTYNFTLNDFSASKSKNETSIESLNIEELTSMIISNVKDKAAKQSQKMMKDIVVTVPPYADFAYR